MRKRNFAGAAAVAAAGAVVRPWRLRWGATDDELEKSLPGDELVHEHAIFEPAHFIMKRKPLIEIKRLAEGAAKGSTNVQSLSLTEEVAEPVLRGANVTFSHPLSIHQCDHTPAR